MNGYWCFSQQQQNEFLKKFKNKKQKKRDRRKSVFLSVLRVMFRLLRTDLPPLYEYYFPWKKITSRCPERKKIRSAVQPPAAKTDGTVRNHGNTSGGVCRKRKGGEQCFWHKRNEIYARRWWAERPKTLHWVSDGKNLWRHWAYGFCTEKCRLQGPPDCHFRLSYKTFVNYKLLSWTLFL